MFGKRSNFWKALVWAMIPFTLAASLPRMSCRCAKAQGLMFCECCFRSSAEKSIDDKSIDAEAPIRNCCRHNAATASDVAVKSTEEAQSGTECPTCIQIKAAKSGGCCDWTSVVLAAPAESVAPSVPMDVIAWDFIICDDASMTLASFTPHGNTSLFVPPLDRITVFQHLVI